MTHLSIQELAGDIAGFVQRLRSGEVVIVEENGVALGKVTPIDKPSGQKRDVSRRLGLLDGQAHIPDDWKDIARDDIEAHFGGL